jgi:hypothetical protein
MMLRLVYISALVAFCNGVSWTLPAFEDSKAANERFCLSQFVGKGQMVVGTVNTTNEADQRLAIEVSCL